MTVGGCSFITLNGCWKLLLTSISSVTYTVDFSQVLAGFSRNLLELATRARERLEHLSALSLRQDCLRCCICRASYVSSSQCEGVPPDKAYELQKAYAEDG